MSLCVRLFAVGIVVVVNLREELILENIRDAVKFVIIIDSDENFISVFILFYFQYYIFSFLVVLKRA